MKTKLWAVLFAFGLSQSAYAQGFSFSPVHININASNSNSSSISFSNNTSKTAAFEIKVFTWSSKNNKSLLTPTRDILYTPAQFELRRGQTQIIRLQMRRPALKNESTYRIVITEKPIEEIKNAVKANIAISLPIFYTPNSAKPKIDFNLMRNGQDLVLKISNTGNSYQRFQAFKAKSQDKAINLRGGTILSGQSSEFVLKGWGNVNGPIKFSYTDKANETKNVEISLK